MGCSQRKFAEISGLSNATISRIENGETHSPDIETLKLLAAHLNYPLDELIKLMEQSLERYKSKGQAKLIFLLTPTRRIKRYSSVCTSIIEKEEEQLKEQTLEQAPDQETHKDISLKGMRLITLRLEKNITQKELAEALSIDKSLISQYEGEIIKPDYVLIQRLADFFDVTVEYLTDSLVSEVISYQETKDLFRDTTRDKLLQTKGLRPEYLVIAEEIQDAGIEVEDVRAFIKLIKKYKGSSI
jgi:transcriptional regulator with XRE-family HTH domain